MGSLFSLTLLKNMKFFFLGEWILRLRMMVLDLIGFGFLGNIERVVFLSSFIFPVSWTLS